MIQIIAVLCILSLQVAWLTPFFSKVNSLSTRTPLVATQILCSISVIHLATLFAGLIPFYDQNYLIAIGVTFIAISFFRIFKYHQQRIYSQKLRSSALFLLPTLMLFSTFGLFIDDQTWDSSMYHNVISLAFQRDFQLTGWPDLTPWQWYPSTIDSLRGLASVPTSALGNSLFNWIFFFLSGWACLERFDVRNKVSRFVIVLVPLSIPVFVSQIPTSYIDLIFAALVVILIVELVPKSRHENAELNPAYAITIFFIMTFFIASKWTSLLVVVSLLFSFALITTASSGGNFKLIVKRISYLSVSYLMGCIIGLLPWILRNKIDGKSSFFPVSIFGSADTPYTFQLLQDQSSLQNRSIGAQITGLLKHDGFDLIVYNYLFTPFEFPYKLLKVLKDFDDDESKKWLLSATNYDARIGGFFLLFEICLFSLLAFALYSFIKKKVNLFRVLGNPEFRLILLIIIALVFIILFSDVAWYPRYWMGFAWIFIVLVFNYLVGRLRNDQTISIVFVTLTSISIFASVGSFTGGLADNFGTQGYAEPLLAKKIAFVNDLDLHEVKCVKTIIIGYQLQFSSSVLIPPCSEKIQTIIPLELNYNLDWGQSRPNDSRKLLSQNDFAMLLASEKNPTLLIVASHNLDDLKRTKKWLEEIESQSNIRISDGSQTNEPFLTFIELYMVFTDKT